MRSPDPIRILTCGASSAAGCQDAELAARAPLDSGDQTLNSAGKEVGDAGGEDGAPTALPRAVARRHGEAHEAHAGSAVEEHDDHH